MKRKPPRKWLRKYRSLRRQYKAAERRYLKWELALVRPVEARRASRKMTRLARKAEQILAREGKLKD